MEGGGYPSAPPTGAVRETLRSTPVTTHHAPWAVYHPDGVPDVSRCVSATFDRYARGALSITCGAGGRNHHPVMNDTILRFLTMLRMLPRAPRKIDTATMERRLRDDGYAVTRRTIQRDLHQLARTFPLLCDEHRPAGWSWAPATALIDLPGMDPNTALTFVLVNRFLAPLLPRSTFGRIQPYLTQAQKILDSLPTNALGRWPSKVRVIHRSPLLRLPEIPEAILDTVTRGLLDGRRLDVEYRSREKGESTRCLLNPLGLVVKGGIAYLVCTLWDYTDIRQVVLHRVQHAEVLDASVIVPTGFDLDLYIQEGEFAYPVGEPMRLEAVFSHGADFHLHDTPLSADQVLTELDHERVLLRATVENTAELRWWLLGFGELVEVLAPADLREEFRA
jgi:predicted DNA-binding transcriptional regulator YafY